MFIKKEKINQEKECIPQYGLLAQSILKLLLFIETCMLYGIFSKLNLKIINFLLAYIFNV